MTQGLVAFDGLTDIEACQFSLARGVRPSRGVLKSPNLNQTPPATGRLLLVYGATSIRLEECAVVDAFVEASGGGRTLAVTIEDRRWKWRYAQITGRYNVRREGEQLRHEKTPRELAELLLEALGETSYDVSALPNAARPHVHWIAASAADALSRLCAALGCDVTLAPDQSVRIVALGDGEELPERDDLEAASGGVSAAQVPDRLAIACGPARYQCRFLLEPVAEENDDEGTVVPVEEASYKPADWSLENPKTLSGVTGSVTREGRTYENRDAALRSVFRLYRVKSILGGGGSAQLNPPGFADALAAGADELTSIQQLLPLYNELNQTVGDPDAEGARYRPAFVSLRYYDDQHAHANVDELRYPGSWSLDGERGLVRFARPVYELDEQGRAHFPEFIALTCTCEAEWASLHVKTHYQRHRDRVEGADPRLVLVERRPDLTLRYTAQYAYDQYEGVQDNKAEVDAEADYYLDALEQSLAERTTASAQYAGLALVVPDGAIEQVQWSIGPQGTTTRASRFTRINQYVPTYKEFKRQEALDRLLAGERPAAEA